LEDVMAIRSGFGFLGAFLVASLGVAALAVGCQSSTPSGGSGSTVGGGSGGGGTTTTGGSSGGAGQGGNVSAGGEGQGGSQPGTCEGEVHTVQDIASGTIGAGVHVQLKGVVAMTPKFLVSQSSKTGSCLWGFFVSAPGLTETGEHTGLMVVNYGSQAVIPDGGTKAYCPAIGFGDDAGDKIPNDVKPGDVFDIVGTTDSYVSQTCASQQGGAQVGQIQLKNACSITKTGTATPPKAHVFKGADIAKLASPDDADFHGKWGGVLVRVEGVTAEEVAAGDGGAGGGGAGNIVGQYGVITLKEGVQVGDKLYYEGYNKKNVCHAQPTFDRNAFEYIEGISFLNFCTWDIEPSDKCAGFSPQPSDCKAASQANCAGK
jgi:hypothetical protein